MTVNNAQAMTPEAMKENVAKQEWRAEHNRRKASLINAEKENYSRLYLLKSNDKWWELFSHSAVFYAFYIGKMLKNRPRIVEDKDYSGNGSKIGRVAIGSLKDFVDSMKALGLKQARDDEVLKVWELGKRFSQEEFLELLHEDEVMVDRANNIARVKDVMPDLRAEARAFLVELHSQIRNQDQAVKIAFLGEVERVAVRLNRNVVAVSRGTMTRRECLTAVGADLVILYEYMTVMNDMGLLYSDKYYDLVLRLKQLEDQMKRDLKKVAVEEAEKEAKKIVAKERKNDEATASDDKGGELGGAQPDNQSDALRKTTRKNTKKGEAAKKADK